MKTTFYTRKSLFIFLLSLFVMQHSFAQQVANSVKTSNGTVIGFYEFKPTGYSNNTDKQYPLIIFLHGIGERGNGTTELPYVLYHGLPKLIKQGATMTFTNPNTGSKESFIVLSPQLPKYMGYWDNFYVDEMLRYAKSNLRVDTNKIFLTGLSLGGGGAWAYPNTSVAHAKQFAAIAPVCGVCYYNYATLCSTIGAAGLPVWGFTNADDNVVSPSCTIQACDALAKCNPGKIKKTVYPSGGHDAWTKAYDTGRSIQSPNMYEWFLSNSKVPAIIPAAPNQLPVANAGTAQSVTLPVNSVTLNGSSSFDPDGNALSYKWSKMSGPAEVNFAMPAACSTAATNLLEGVYTFSLTVTDTSGGSSTATVQVTVSPAPTPVNQLPVAVAGNPVSITLPVSAVTLTGSATDVDGTIESYKWSLISGPSQPMIVTANEASTLVSGLLAGEYIFRLSVTDNAGGAAYNDVKVTVSAIITTTPPVADAGKDETIPVGQATVIRGDKSTAINATIKSYSWKKYAGPDKYEILNPTAAATWIRNMTAGKYTYRLTVTDSNGLTSFDDVVITVYDKNTNVKPEARAGNDTTVILPVNGVSLDGSRSGDPDGTISVFNWALISGPSQPLMSGTGLPALQVSNLIAGKYCFRLHVTDNAGALASDTVTVTVNAAVTTALPPIADAGKDETIPVGQATVLRGDKSTAPGGTIVSYAWTVVSGPGSYEILSPANYATWIRKMVAGKYIYRLTIVDNNGAVSSDDVVITVYQLSTTGSNTLALAEQPVQNSGIKASIFPNPAQNRLSVSFSSSITGIVRTQILDINGREVKSGAVNKQQVQYQGAIDVSALKPGAYILRLIPANGEVISEKFIKN